MFRPIKNLITYIQKNASGSAIFGSPAAVDEAETEASAAATEEALTEEEATVCQEATEMDKIDIKELNGLPVPVGSLIVPEICTVSGIPIVATPIVLGNTYDEDDIELQIKSSIMLKKPLPAAKCNDVVVVADTLKKFSAVLSESHEVDVVTIDELQTPTVLSSSPDHNQNHTADDELENDLIQNAAADDFCSVGSGDPTGGEDTAGEELNTEEEDVEETFLDFAPELEAFAGGSTLESSEIIVLNDTDLNSSIASDVPSEDPLAIDEFTQRSVKDTRIVLDSSSTNDEASTSTDILWLDVDEPKKSATTPTLPSGAIVPEAPQKRAPLDSIAREQTRQVAREEQAEEFRSDGSDSGLGSETSTLHNTLSSINSTSQLATDTPAPAPVQTPTQQQPTEVAAVTASTTSDASTVSVSSSSSTLRSAITPVTTSVLTLPKKPLRSNLKRRLEEDDDMLDSPTTTVDCVAVANACLASQQKKPKRSINFDTVQVYYFPRQQGFGCVPSAGGCTLGMTAHHVAAKTLTLAEHAAEIRRAHRLQLQEINPRGSSSDDSEESEEDYLSEGSGSDQDAESNGFLQPVSPKQRRALLKAAGVRKIDASEKVECRDIRNSREVCGCTCRDFCDPETCACSQAGIKCQVDRAMFPCGCSRDACGNTVGRVEFNPARVRTHYIHTIMRLEMENRQQQAPPLCGSSSIGYGMSICSASVAAPTSATGVAQPGATHTLSQSYYGLQTQSNYSSGYASPAYTSDPTANYYQPQPTQPQTGAYGALTTLQPDLHHQQHATPQYQLDSLDSSLFSGASTATPSYGELMPVYGAVSTATASASAAVYHNLSYSTTVNGGMQAQVSAYASYQQHHLQSTAHYLTPTHSSGANSRAVLPPSSTFSSCAVPSAPPYGTATTTIASSQYHSACSSPLKTTAPSCSAIDGIGIGVGGVVGGGAAVGSSSFIDLDTPIASSSRLSQINDLLQHNRNTTAALVAVSQNAALSGAACAAPLLQHSTAATASIDTPPIEDAHKSCLAFEELPAPLHPTPIVAVLEQAATASSKVPPIAAAATTALSVTTATPIDKDFVATAMNNINTATTTTAATTKTLNTLATATATITTAVSD